MLTNHIIMASVMDWIKYEIVPGNALWRFAALLFIFIMAMALGKISQHLISIFAKVTYGKKKVSVITLFFNSMSKPSYVLIMAIAFNLSRLLLVFESPQATPPVIGLSQSIAAAWAKIASVFFAVSIAYALFHLVDIIEYYMRRVTGRTQTKLDDMLVPVIRKSLRITISIISALFIAENILGAGQVKSLIVSAGVGGIAIALAAKDTLSNFFGSITIFADRPFHIHELIKINDYLGTIEEVGFRSSKLRTLEGSLVTIPNSTIANSFIENIGRRGFVRRTSNITITYDSTHIKALRAVEIIKEILSQISEINTDKDFLPKVYFDDFNDWSLNIYMTYWVYPADWWFYKAINKHVNLKMMKRFEQENIDFAFPSQTLYMRKGNV